MQAYTKNIKSYFSYSLKQAAFYKSVTSFFRKSCFRPHCLKKRAAVILNICSNQHKKTNFNQQCDKININRGVVIKIF